MWAEPESVSVSGDPFDVLPRDQGEQPDRVGRVLVQDQPTAGQPGHGGQHRAGVTDQPVTSRSRAAVSSQAIRGLPGQA